MVFCPQVQPFPNSSSYIGQNVQSQRKINRGRGLHFSRKQVPQNAGGWRNYTLTGRVRLPVSWFRADDEAPKISNYPAEGLSATRLQFAIMVAAMASLVLGRPHVRKESCSGGGLLVSTFGVGLHKLIGCFSSAKPNIMDVQNADQIRSSCLSNKLRLSDAPVWWKTWKSKKMHNLMYHISLRVTL